MANIYIFRLMARVHVVQGTRGRDVRPGAARGGGAWAVGGSVPVGPVTSVTPSPGTVCRVGREPGGRAVVSSVPVTRGAPRSAPMWTEGASVRETTSETSVNCTVPSGTTRSLAV